ncbi:DNA glycosylase [Xylariaceae sp. AK1471]|nr:DNA glycosylase [Xylariaceae sp. AK1471]
MARRSTRARANANAVPVKGGWDVLPHNMGRRTTATAQSADLAAATAPSTIKQEPQPVDLVAATALSTADQKPANASDVEQRDIEEASLRMSKQQASDLSNIDDADSSSQPRLGKPNRATRKTRSQAVDYIINLQLAQESIGGKAEDANQDLEDGIPAQNQQRVTREIKEEDDNPEQATAARRSKRTRKQIKDEEDYDPGQDATPKRAKRTRKQAKVEGDGEDVLAKTKRVPKKTKDNPYGLTPGRSPFPDWEAPSAAQCEEVYRILADMHDDVQPQSPEVIPAPSLEITGCGEVPYVLEALIRTLLSGAVTFAGAAKMLKGIITKYGVLEDGLAKGSVDWNKVRLSPIEDLVGAIQEGGLAKIKAKHIKGTLDMVYQENVERRKAYLAERETGTPANVCGASEKTQSQKDLEVLKTEQNVLSLDHMRGLSADEAMRQFTKFPGIGVKTAACVILFCLQMPCFAVDTHVHRFSKWLGWAPIKADENDVFGHLEVRCPDHLKYGLHQLFIRHGQTCGRCKTSTAEGTKEWDAVVCPLEHLLVRSKKMAKPKKGPKQKATEADDKDDSESELSDVDEALFLNENFEV